MMARRHPYECMCTVTVKITESSADKFSKEHEEKKEIMQEGTSSGIVIDSRKGLVLTHASLLYPLMSKIKPSKLKLLKQSGIVHGSILNGKVETVIMLQNIHTNSMKGHDSEEKEKHYNPAVLKCNIEEETTVLSHRAKLKSFFECKALKRALHHVMPSDAWQFVDGMPSDTSDSCDDASKAHKDDELFYHFLPYFMLFQLSDWSPFESELRIKKGLQNHIGDPVEICATPFGGLNPDVFLNSRSRGIISNMAGSRNVLLLTDARCVPGSEGGGLFYCQGKQR